MMNASASASAAGRGYTNRDFSHSPLLVFYEVTQACDLVCAHCRACAQTEPHPHELSSSEARQLVDQLGDFPKPPMLVLTGGDPLKRPDIFELVEYASQAGLDVSITPSATPLVTRPALARLQAAGIVRMAVSLDGVDDETHDRQRGVRGSFQRTLGILADARDLGIPIQVNTTMNPTNFGQVDAMAERLADFGIVLWSVFFLVPVGRAANADRLSAASHEWIFERLWQQSLRQPYAIKTTEAPHYRRYVLERRRQLGQTRNGDFRPNNGRPGRRTPSALGINDGKGTLFVGRTGLIHPSGFMPIVCGLFPLDHVVNVYQQSPVFRGLRDANRLEGKCGQCEYRHLCGGSRARAYALAGNPFAEEPDCSYTPVALR